MGQAQSSNVLQHGLARIDHLVEELSQLRADLGAMMSDALQPKFSPLGVPYRSQWDGDAALFASDCGPACAAMTLDYYGWHVTVDDLARACGMGAKKNCTLPADLISVLADHGVHAQRYVGMSVTDLSSETRAGRPVIVLVHYGSLGDLRQDRNFSAGHWLVVTGVTAEAVFVNDPNFRAPRRNDGAGLFVARETFERAWADCARDGNTAHQGLVIISADIVPQVGT